MAHCCLYEGLCGVLCNIGSPSGNLKASCDKALGHRFNTQGGMDIIGVYFHELKEERLCRNYMCYVPLSSNPQDGYFRVVIHVLANYHHNVPYTHSSKQRVMRGNSLTIGESFITDALKFRSSTLVRWSFRIGFFLRGTSHPRCPSQTGFRLNPSQRNQNRLNQCMMVLIRISRRLAPMSSRYIPH